MFAAAAKVCEEPTTWPDAIVISVLIICGTIVAIALFRHLF